LQQLIVAIKRKKTFKQNRDKIRLYVTDPASLNYSRVTFQSGRSSSVYQNAYWLL